MAGEKAITERLGALPLSYTNRSPQQDSNLRPPALEAKYPLSTPPAKLHESVTLSAAQNLRICLCIAQNQGTLEASFRVSTQRNIVSRDYAPVPQSLHFWQGYPSLLGTSGGSNSSLSPLVIYHTSRRPASAQEGASLSGNNPMRHRGFEPHPCGSTTK